MDVSEFNDEDSATSFHNQPRCDDALRYPTDTTLAIVHAMQCASVVVGIPGSILSAIVWMRRRIAGKMSSAVYLAALSVNDLACLLAVSLSIFCDDRLFVYDQRSWLCHGALYIRQSTGTLEPLLVLSFSIERLIAILRPLQVCPICTTCIYACVSINCYQPRQRRIQGAGHAPLPKAPLNF